MLVVDWDGRSRHLSFHKEGEGAVVPAAARAARAGSGAQAAKATGGRAIENPTTVVVREARAPAALPSAVPSPVSSGRRKTDTP
jgi:hypothetical protein